MKAKEPARLCSLGRKGAGRGMVAHCRFSLLSSQPNIGLIPLVRVAGFRDQPSRILQLASSRVLLLDEALVDEALAACRATALGAVEWSDEAAA